MSVCDLAPHDAQKNRMGGMPGTLRVQYDVMENDEEVDGVEGGVANQVRSDEGPNQSDEAPLRTTFSHLSPITVV